MRWQSLISLKVCLSGCFNAQFGFWFGQGWFPNTHWLFMEEFRSLRSGGSLCSLISMPASSWSLPFNFRIVRWFKWYGMRAVALVSNQVLLHRGLQPLQLLDRVVLVLGVGLWGRLLCLNRVCPILLLGAGPVELYLGWLAALSRLFDDIRNSSFQSTYSVSQLRILCLWYMSKFLTIDSSLGLISASLSLLNRFDLAHQLVVSSWSKVFELHWLRLQKRV